MDATLIAMHVVAWGILVALAAHFARSRSVRAFVGWAALVAVGAVVAGVFADSDARWLVTLVVWVALQFALYAAAFGWLVSRGASVLVILLVTLPLCALLIAATPWLLLLLMCGVAGSCLS